MPELPEVETLKISLEKELLGKTFTSIELKRPKLRNIIDKEIASKIIKAKVLKLTRRAKYLIIELDNGNSIIIHLGMSGRVVSRELDYDLQKHDHVILYLNDQRKLVFNDVRRFGMIYCLPNSNLMEQQIFQNLGPEPLESEFSASYLEAELKNKKAPIKTVLMQNDIVVGVGNIYASESLFLAKINPQRIANSLSSEEITALVKAIKQVLKYAIEAGGTTLRDFVDGDNKPGYFKQKLLVYGKENISCTSCGDKIIKLKQAGRSSFFCNTCQR